MFVASSWMTVQIHYETFLDMLFDQNMGMRGLIIQPLEIGSGTMSDGSRNLAESRLK